MQYLVGLVVQVEKGHAGTCSLGYDGDNTEANYTANQLINKNIEECKNYTCWLVFVYHPQQLLEQLPEQLPKPIEISMLESYWLAPLHPILNAKFSPITAFLNRSTYHKSTKGSPPPCPQILWAPQINE